MTFTRLNPLTGEVASTAPAMQAADIPAIAARAAAAFPAWAAQGPNARRDEPLPRRKLRAGGRIDPRA